MHRMQPSPQGTTNLVGFEMLSIGGLQPAIVRYGSCQIGDLGQAHVHC